MTSPETAAATQKGPSQKVRKALDMFEQGVALALYIWLVHRLWPNEFSATNWYPVLLLASEGIVIVLLLLRRHTDCISISIRDWFIAFAGTFLALMVNNGGEPISLLGGGLMMILGIIVHVTAKFNLWRSFGLVAANRGVKRGGLYKLVRHPMYMGYMLLHIGYLLFAPTLWNLGIYISVWIFLILRIFAEERILCENPEYREYAEKVRFRIIPGVF
ncbi:MAG: DUF1295 domain-containing protein [Alphaproteobacteria bacterium]|nr:DUF1295 domain-containing protein [Alphaproteobacteria bacterium]